MAENRFHGIAVSPGIIIGKVFLFDSKDDNILPHYISINQVDNEKLRLDSALFQTRREIYEIEKKITQKLGPSHAQIFLAHMMILNDPSVLEQVQHEIEDNLFSVEYAYYKVIQGYIKSFANIKDAYLRERAVDIKDVMRRVLGHLMGKRRDDLKNLKEEVVIVAVDLTPSDTATMHHKKVTGFATDVGGRTSHTAIMARALEIPAVVGLGDFTKYVNDGDLMIVDGNEGVVIINPKKSTIKKYSTQKVKLEEIEHQLESLKNLPSVTIDDHKILLSANIELPQEVKTISAHGTNDIGLYRTEFLYLNRDQLPTEDEQVKAYLEVAQQVKNGHVVIRTFDLGGDKISSLIGNNEPEINPFLGVRAIRFCLNHIDIFKVQLRAILRASYLKNIRLMYPMISSVDELRQANQILNEVKEELRQENKKFDEKIKVGMMIEVPSAALIADLLAKEVDFFSIGTNDLIQYCVAVDRGNEKIAHLYQPAHPGIIKLIDQIVKAGHNEGIWVGMCGEMAGDPLFTILLLGLGLDELSVSPVILPTLKKIIRSADFSQAKQLAQYALGCSSMTEVMHRIKKDMKKK